VSVLDPWVWEWGLHQFVLMGTTAIILTLALQQAITALAGSQAVSLSAQALGITATMATATTAMGSMDALLTMVVILGLAVMDRTRFTADVLDTDFTADR
jgi:hypothetical protein